MAQRRVLLIVVTLIAALGAWPAGASAASPYEVEVTTQSPQLRYFGSFSYDTAVVNGPNPRIASLLTRKVRAFTMPWADYYRNPDAKTVKYLKKAQPAYFETSVIPTPGCKVNYVCVSQGSSFSTPLIAGSITDIHARAWSTRTGKAAKLKDFVAPAEVNAFTQRVKREIRTADCYYGFEIDLPAKYSSFPHWVPLESGIGVWFPEYEFGCQVMELRVPWK